MGEGESFAHETIKAAIEAGINFFDTANVYSAGSSEEFTGRALKEFAEREDIVLATKVQRPDAARAERRRPVAQGDPSGDRRQPAPPRAPTTSTSTRSIGGTRRPIEETMEALHDVVRAGKARYIGASSMYAWQFAKAQHVAERHGWTPFVSMQNHYNLLYREEEREMIPLCLDQGVGVIPWSPLARGRLTRPGTAQPSGATTTSSAARSTATRTQRSWPRCSRSPSVAASRPPRSPWPG